MTRLLYWLGILMLTALVTHLSYVLFFPKYEVRALMQDMRQRIGVNTFHLIAGKALRRLVRHPLPDAFYGACVLDLEERRATLLQGPDLRSLWALTLYSRRGDVIYAITDRHVPPGPINVQFEYVPQTDDGEIALPHLEQDRMVVPLPVRRALLVLEAFPWHPGQRRLVLQLTKGVRCKAMEAERQPSPATQPRNGKPAGGSLRIEDGANFRVRLRNGGGSSVPTPLPRPLRQTP